MSDNWAQRERNTHRLISAIADHVLQNRNITATQLYGLCQLTWLTKGSGRDDGAYIRSTKLPALTNIFGDRIRKKTLEQAASDVARILGNPDAVDWLREQTGFTHFYAAYRNSSLPWIEDNLEAVVHLVRSARKLVTDE